MSTRALFYDEMSETTGVGVSDWVILERVLARWWHLVAFMKALDLLHRAMRSVSYRRIVMVIEWPARWVHFASAFRLLLPWRSPRQYGASSCPMATFSGFMKALDLLHEAMHAVLHHRTAMVVKMASAGGTFVHCHRLFCLINIAKRPC